MAERLSVDLFVEDYAQNEILQSIVRRVAREESKSIVINERSAVGGHARVAKELDLYQMSVEKGAVPSPDILVVGWDANCKGAKARDEVERILRNQLRSRAVIACPEPHIERWYLIDQVAFSKVVGWTPAGGLPKCEKDVYKRMLADAVAKGGQVSPLGGVEFAPDLVAEMNWYRCGKADAAFKRFLSDLQGVIRSVP